MRIAEQTQLFPAEIYGKAAGCAKERFLILLVF